MYEYRDSNKRSSPTQSIYCLCFGRPLYAIFHSDTNRRNSTSGFNKKYNKCKPESCSPNCYIVEARHSPDKCNFTENRGETNSCGYSQKKKPKGASCLIYARSIIQL